MDDISVEKRLQTDILIRINAQCAGLAHDVGGHKGKLHFSMFAQCGM